MNRLIGLSCVMMVILGGWVRHSPGTNSPIVPTDTIPGRFGFGRAASAAHLTRLDSDVRPDGIGLPPGSGTAGQGAVLFRAKCAACHGPGGTGGPNGALVMTAPADALALSGKRPERVIGNYWPYATTVFDYIRRAMPFNAPGSLIDDEVYALTAYLLSANKVMDSTMVLNANTLPTICMPAQHLFVPDDRRGGPEIR
ncbi:c-type cytochrome [Rudanella paleaurantiibacter]|uniref:C-type cytochrome n=1 Tax=Rudanella paleaurantiibacter TaxID=2614655 RepID=A0A7J5TTV7_9BACT|nr:c-type cytochrome [Rudanella paleaurantiibacter]KAB7727334.1 c-type cytochrome [Rudanella paleaurantiibacter]